MTKGFETGETRGRSTKAMMTWVNMENLKWTNVHSRVIYNALYAEMDWTHALNKYSTQ